jgi:hypothetical protein
MKRVVAIAALFAVGTAYGVGLGMGGFAGAAIPVGDYLMGDLFKTSPKFGGKFLVGATPTFDVEFAFAYHVKHAYKYDDVTKMTIIPITFGVTAKEMFGNAGIFLDGGFGLYMQKITSKYYADDSSSKPGFYFGWGFVYKFGPAAFNFNPRFNYVFDTFSDEGWGLDDTYVEGLIGFDYYFMM